MDYWKKAVEWLAGWLAGQLAGLLAGRLAAPWSEWKVALFQREFSVSMLSVPGSDMWRWRETSDKNKREFRYIRGLFSAVK